MPNVGLTQKKYHAQNIPFQYRRLEKRDRIKRLASQKPFNQILNLVMPLGNASASNAHQNKMPC